MAKGESYKCALKYCNPFTVLAVYFWIVKIKKYIIAIIDDDEDDCELLTSVFRENYDNVAILPFESGRDFLDFVKLAPTIPQLVICDLYMPQLTGLDVIAAMHAEPALAEIPIILLSTIRNEPAVAKVDLMPLVHYYIKPHNLPDYSVLAEDIMHKTLPHYTN